MSKGEVTREVILKHAAGIASVLGLEGLTIGSLAEDLRMSKSGLFAHFRSKEALQVEVLQFAAARFIEHVVQPALKARRGETRLRALVDRWLVWPGVGRMPGGCFFVAAASELDDRPGLARDLLAQQQKAWLETLAKVIRGAIAEGQFRKDVDPEQLAFELYGIMFIFHMSRRLLEDPQAEARARRAVDSLIAGAR